MRQVPLSTEIWESCFDHDSQISVKRGMDIIIAGSIAGLGSGIRWNGCKNTGSKIVR